MKSISGRSLFVLATIAIAAIVSPAQVALADNLVLHVATSGSDQANGEETSPLATPHGAIDRLPAIAAAQPNAQVHVLLRTGVYNIDRPLVIERKHVPAHGNLTFVAADENRVSISGGRKIVGWQVANDGTWSTAVPKAANGRWRFRELFVDGQRRSRARHPNAGFLRVHQAFDDKRSGFTFNQGDLPETWTGDGELVFLHDWSTSRIAVRSVEHDTRRLTAAFPIGNRADHYKIDHFEPHPRYYVEDHRAFLDAPGEWLLKDDVLLYRPLADEEPEATVTIAPLAEALVSVTGDDEGPVRGVHFRGIVFEHCAWPLPPRGFAASQATAYERRGEEPRADGRNFIPAALNFERAEDCSVSHCRVANVGASGIQFGSRTLRCRLEDCIVEDISGNGVNLGEDTSRVVKGRPWWQSAPPEAAASHVVMHNRIERCGQQFYGAVAVWVGIGRAMQITNNEIAHHPYTGVSLGWMWNPTPTPAGENVVAQNHIHHVMQVLGDGGGIYTLGRQPGTKLLGNVIHDVPLNAGRAESNGMFLDEGSDQSQISDNTIYSVARSPLRFHHAQSISVRGNTLVIPDADTPAVRYNSTNAENVEFHENVVFEQARFEQASVVPPNCGPRK